MENLEILKQELILQKSEIESKGGKVQVANLNPSPSEITAGIKSIEAGVDLTNSTATEQDVLVGKTFYSGNSQLKTGKLEVVSTDFTLATATPQDVVLGKTFYAGDSELKVGAYDVEAELLKERHIFEYEQEVKISETRYVYNVNPQITALRYGFFRNNFNNIDIYFHSGITSIGSYCFANTPNFRFFNFSDMTNLEIIDTYAFEVSNSDTLDLTAFPDSVKTIGQKAFSSMLKEGASVVLPRYLETLQQYAFQHQTTVHLNKFDIPETCKLTTLTPYSAYGICSQSHLYVPTAKTVGARFNYNGSFKHITFPSTVTSIADKSFSSDTNKPLSDCYLETVTFLGATPPTIPTEPFSQQAVENGFKIYVPDESIEAYKAKFAARYQNCIFPMSQKA